jgi:flagellar L-ring protein precursor FlgH
VLLALAAVACTTHIAPYRPKQRRFTPGDYAERPAAKGSSLYAGGARGLFEDDRAGRVGDIIIISISESETATRQATTKLSRTNDQSFGVQSSMGILDTIAAAHPSFNPASLLGATSASAFEGDGSVARSGLLVATLPVRVRRVLVNGDLFVEGTKVIMVDHEEHHLYVSGIIHPTDIDDNNTVPSSRLADAEIEYTGRGDMSDQQRPGWLSRILTKVWPF